MTLRRRWGQLAAAGALAILLPTISALPASAATYTSNGRRCTKVGTSGNDVLTGTAGRDVICGLGGNDRIRGLGGDDVIDGGSGNDVIHGAAGNDVVLGGSGNDREAGDTGADHVEGDSGNDVIWGGSGNDVVYGELGDDVLSGSDGTDVLWGGDGSDDLNGGAGADRLAGGAGTNWCTMDPADTTHWGCIYDTKPAWVGTLKLSTARVDVTSAGQVVRFAAWVGDDTGVRQVQVNVQSEDAVSSLDAGWPALTSGTVRGGWWSGSVTVPRWLPPGSLGVYVYATDRVGRMTSRDFPNALSVVDRTPDTTMPVVRSLWISPSSVDVRLQAQTVTAKVHITDDRSGVQPLPYLCPSHRYEDGFRMADGCQMLERYAGTDLDGWWRGSYTVPRGGFGGDWNFSVWLTDQAHPRGTAYWMGPDDYASSVAGYPTPDPSYHRLPGGAGRFTVKGTGDTNAPVLRTVSISPASVDTLPSSKVVTVSVAASDVEGITDVNLFLTGAADSSAPSPFNGMLTQPTSGTARNGVWTFAVVLPQGTPVGTYYLQVMLNDRSHSRNWLSPGSPYAGTAGFVVMSPAQTPGTSGVIRVTPHSG